MAVAEAVGDLLRLPAGDAEPLGQFSRAERVRQRIAVGEQVEQIVWRVKLVRPVVSNQFAVDDSMVLPAPASPPLRTAPFFDIDSSDFDNEPLVRKDGREVDPVFEQIENGPSSRRQPAFTGRIPPTVDLDDPLPLNERPNDANAVSLEQFPNLRSNRSQSGLLDLDQFARRFDVDSESSDARLAAAIGPGVVCLELLVERRFHGATVGS